jgi:hypothetical protein
MILIYDQKGNMESNGSYNMTKRTTSIIMARFI